MWKTLIAICLLFTVVSFARASGDPPGPAPAPTWDAPTPPVRAAPPETRATPVSKPAQKKRSR